MLDVASRMIKTFSTRLIYRCVGPILDDLLL